jgi:asparagine synthase (glutamine-hydrolysing)
MSGFVLVHQRDGAPVEAATFAGMMATLKHRGPDGQDGLCQQSLALGHQHFWTTPEEVGERQPLWTDGGRFGLVFDGRLDNRDELLPALGLYGNAARHTTDAALVLRCYEKWDEQCFGRFLGPFSLVIYDKVCQRVVCARDPLGDRTLFYFLDDRIFLVASEEQALLGHPAVANELDDTTLAYYFAVHAPSNGRTFFKDVCELLPAHALVVSMDRVQSRRYWDVDPEKRLVYRSDAEYSDHFRELLDKGVQRCLRAVGPPAIMMSGGLDSTSVTALAARRLAAGDKPDRLYTLSWVFDKFPTCDERTYMDPLIEQYNLRAIRVNGDGDWPLSDAFNLEAYNPGYPYINPYHRLKRRLYQAAHDNQVRVLLTGEFGDELYTGAEYWLLDLLLERLFSEARREFLQSVGKFGPRRVLASRSLRRVGVRLLSQLPGTQRLLRRGGGAQVNQPAWLTAYARQRLSSLDEWPPSAARAGRPGQHRTILGMYSALGVSVEFSQANRLGVEIRHPYRDRQLIEFMLAVTAHQLYKRQRHKHILRTAMADLLPANILHRVGPTSLLPFYRYGLMQVERPLVHALLNQPEAMWRRFVQPEWLESIVWQRLENDPDGREALLPWRSLSLEQWLEVRRSANNEQKPVS